MKLINIALVYQAGIANVFEIKNVNLKQIRTRLLQADFASCEWYARGCKHCGAIVRVFACNKAGDITNELWSTPLDEAPFREQFNCKSFL